jgi:hypothetical protein
MQSNIPVKFHDSKSNTFWCACDTKDNFIFNVFDNNITVYTQVYTFRLKASFSRQNADLD